MAKDKGVPGGLVGTARDIVFWWNAARAALVIAAALGFFTLNRDGSVFDWDPSIGAVVNDFAGFLDNLFGPLERAVEALFALLNLDWRLGAAFRVICLISVAALGASVRAGVPIRIVVYWALALLAFALIFGLINPRDVPPQTQFWIASVEIGAIGLFMVLVQAARIGRQLLYILVVMAAIFALNQFRLMSAAA